MTEVKNIKGTVDNYPKNGYYTWKEFWEDKKGRKFSTCSCCNGRAEVGAHVIKVSYSNRWYIVPLCRSCNQKETSFMVRDADLEPVIE